MNRISTYTHGIIDYMTAALLIALPFLLRWDGVEAQIFWIAGAILLGQSLMTRYELSLFKAIPMPVHLMMDMLMGLVLLVLPFVMRFEDPYSTAAYAIIGLMEIAVSAMTTKESTTHTPIAMS